MSFENWQRSYQEVKNIIHNDIGVSKEDIREVFREIAKEEIGKLVEKNRPFILESVREVIRSEMIKAVKENKYPEVKMHKWFYGNGDGVVRFEDFIAGVMKDEIADLLYNRFNVSVNVDRKAEEE
jgi:hypothetical protein